MADPLALFDASRHSQAAYRSLCRLVKLTLGPASQAMKVLSPEYDPLLASLPREPFRGRRRLGPRSAFH